MQKARRQALVEQALPIALRPLVGVWFQGQCPPLIGVLPIVRSRYYSLSVAGEYLALGDGPPRFRPTFTYWAVLRIPPGPRPVHLRGFHPLRPAVPRRSVWPSGPCGGPSTPGGVARRLGLFRGRSPLPAESLLLSLPPGTEMFQFPGSARAPRDQRPLGGSPGPLGACPARPPPGA